ncbi:MAG: hypothetical protein WA862_13685 [Solirubrobacterales bacterium]
MQDARVADGEFHFAIGFDRDNREGAAVPDRGKRLLPFRSIPGRQDEDLGSRPTVSGHLALNHLALKMDYALAIEVEGGKRTRAGVEVPGRST